MNAITGESNLDSLEPLPTKVKRLKFYRKLRKDIARMIVDVREYKISFCGAMTLEQYMAQKGTDGK